MTEGITSTKIVEAAQALGTEEFSRGDLAAQLGVEKADIKPAFREARHQGKLEKVRDDEENTGYFKLTGN
ncbi:MAG: hypothetical protein QOI10_1618 [Solirubrobacterales bacterium]|jgi:hypothetical protein|nr:hypothetical protein [Solirubrobacterales bacterium]